MSGATHLAIGGDNLVMSPFSALGSVDPTRNHPLLPRDTQGNPSPASVQDLKHCMDFVKENVKKDEALGPLVAQIFSQVHPLAIGAIEQSYKLGRLITEKVLATRKKKLSADRVNAIVKRLAGESDSRCYSCSLAPVASGVELSIPKVGACGDPFYCREAVN